MYHVKTNTESKLPKLFAQKDKNVVEVRETMPQTVFMRHLPSNVETHKFEGHSLPVERLVMLSDSAFLSQAGYEVLLWTSERK